MKAPSAAILSLVTAALALGADRLPQAPKPEPEVQRLGYYIGKWEGHGESKGGPFGPAGKLSSKSECSWFTGEFQVVCRGEESGPTGTQQFLNIKFFDTEAKSFSEYSITNTGEHEAAQGGTIAGNKVSYIRDIGTGKDAVNIRYTEVRVAPDRYTYKAEASIAAGPRQLIAEGEIKRAK